LGVRSAITTATIYSARSSSSPSFIAGEVDAAGALPAADGRVANMEVRRSGPDLLADTGRFISSGCMVDRLTAEAATGGGADMLNLANELLILLLGE